jgi:hypothetical protein
MGEYLEILKVLIYFSVDRLKSQIMVDLSFKSSHKYFKIKKYVLIRYLFCKTHWITKDTLLST